MRSSCLALRAGSVLELLLKVKSRERLLWCFTIKISSNNLICVFRSLCLASYSPCFLSMRISEFRPVDSSSE